MCVRKTISFTDGRLNYEITVNSGEVVEVLVNDPRESCWEVVSMYTLPIEVQLEIFRLIAK